jgi:uncharacterized protein
MSSIIATHIFRSFLVAAALFAGVTCSVNNQSNTTVSVSFVSNNFRAIDNPTSCKVSTLYGDFDVHEPVLIELFQSNVIERIKHVRQYGVSYFIDPALSEYSRYEHCIGVWALLRRNGASLNEQIAGLLHDVSHTVFSHVGDRLFGHLNQEHSYQDNIHAWYLSKQGIDAVLAKHGIELESIMPDSGAHRMLEQPLPDICCDRYEYNLQAGRLTGMLDQKDIMAIVDDLTFQSGKWVFNDKALAKKFALVSLYNTEYTWGSVYSDALPDMWTAEALSRAIEKGILTFDDIHFSTDDAVWNILTKSDDSTIASCIEKILGYKKKFVFASRQKHDQIITTKFRGIDPLVKTDNGFERLTALDDDYKAEYERVKEQVIKGWPILFV